MTEIQLTGSSGKDTTAVSLGSPMTLQIDLVCTVQH